MAGWAADDLCGTNGLKASAAAGRRVAVTTSCVYITTENGSTDALSYKTLKVCDDE